jgi:hypothetical protein
VNRSAAGAPAAALARLSGGRGGRAGRGGVNRGGGVGVIRPLPVL